MTDGLANFGKENDTGNTQARTNIELENPRHPDKEPDYAAGNDAEAYFDAAVAALNWEADRRALVGAFLVGVEGLIEDAECQTMGEFLVELTGEDVVIYGEEFTADDDSDE